MTDVDIVLERIADLRDHVVGINQRLDTQNGRLRGCESRIAVLNLAVFGVGAVGWAAIVGVLLKHIGML